VFAGFYIVPLFALVQSRAPKTELSRVIAGNNILNALLICLASGFGLALGAVGLTAVQIFLAGLGTFGFDTSRPADASHALSLHQGLGFALAGVSILILVLAIAARAGRLALWLAGALVVQTCLLQSLLDGLAGDTAVFGGLHALDGLLIAASAGVQYVLARRR